MITKPGTRSPGPGRRLRPRSRQPRPASARALAAARVFHEPLTGRGDDRLPRPGQMPEPAELHDDVLELT